jgi:hypothetical protein
MRLNDMEEDEFLDEEDEFSADVDDLGLDEIF